MCIAAEHYITLYGKCTGTFTRALHTKVQQPSQMHCIQLYSNLH